MTAQLPINGGVMLKLDNGELVEVYMQEDISGLGQSLQANYLDPFGNTVSYIIAGPFPANEWAATIANDHGGGIGNYLHFIQPTVQAMLNAHFVTGPGAPVTNSDPYTIEKFNLALRQYSRLDKPASPTGAPTWVLLA